MAERVRREEADRHDFPQAPLSESISQPNRAQLERQLNFLNSPGRHSALSPVAGSSAAGLQNLISLSATTPSLGTFAAGLYNPAFKYLIPERFSQQAEAIAKGVFQSYISRYKAAGVNETNIVSWTTTPITRTYINDVENKGNTWNVQPVVYSGSDTRGGMYFPRYVGAYHEVMHVESIPRRAGKDWDRNFGEIPELAPTMMTIIIQDDIYKKVNGMPLGSVADHHQSVQWEGHSVPLGQVANLYRRLLEQYGNIYEALSSPESLYFMRTGSIPPAMQPQRHLP